MQRGQGLPLNTIIISIIVIVVLVVIILIFTGNLGTTATTLRSCAAQGGACVGEDTCTGTVVPGTCAAKEECCVNVGGQDA